MTSWYMPHSRAWAAAIEAGGRPERFAAALPAVGRRKRSAVLARISALSAANAAAAETWEDAFFGDRSVSLSDRVGIETVRAGSLAPPDVEPLGVLEGRDAGAAGCLGHRVPAAVEARHGQRRAGRAAAYPMPGDTDIEQSRHVIGHNGREYWLRFDSPWPEMGDLVWAHVYEPDDVADPPTMIYLHACSWSTICGAPRWTR